MEQKKDHQGWSFHKKIPDYHTNHFLFNKESLFKQFRVKL